MFLRGAEHSVPLEYLLERFESNEQLDKRKASRLLMEEALGPYPK